MKLAAAAIYVLFLSLAGAGAGGTCSYFVTLARSHVGEATTAGSAEVLEVAGSFDWSGWKDGKGSGIEIKNLTKSGLWVYFEVTGTLREAVKPVSPVYLPAGQACELPLEVNSENDMGLLQWRNQERVFSGEIVARVLNNYAEYRTGEIKMAAGELFELFSPVKAGPGGEAGSLKGVKDIIALIDRLNSLKNQISSLQEQVDVLQCVNGRLLEENRGLKEQMSRGSNEKAAAAKPAGEKSAGGSEAGGPSAADSPAALDGAAGKEAGTDNTTGKDCGTDGAPADAGGTDGTPADAGGTDGTPAGTGSPDGAPAGDAGNGGGTAPAGSSDQGDSPAGSGGPAPGDAGVKGP